MPKAGTTHDISFLEPTADTEIGLMLVRVKGVPQYKIIDDAYLPAQYMTGVPGYGNLPPEKELAIRQDDWRHGFGQEYYSSEYDKAYHSSIGADARFKGMAVGGPKATAATLPTLFSLTDGGMEVWTDANTLTNWTKVGEGLTLTRESTTKHGGTYSAKIYKDSQGAASIYQDLGDWSNDFRDKQVVVSAWLHASAATTTRIAITDGDGTTYSLYHSGGGGWEQLTVKKVLDSSADKIRIEIHNVVTAQTIYADDVTVSTLGTHGSHWAEFDGDLFFSSGKCLLRVNNSTGAITFAGAFPNDITALEPFVDDNLYIAQGAGHIELTLAEALDNSETGVDVSDASSSPNLSFYIRIDDEVMKVTAIASNTLTVTRAQWGTAAATHTSGATIYCACAWWYMSDSEALTEGTINYGTAQQLETVDVTLWASFLPREVRSGTDPTNGGSMSAATLVDSTAYNIKELLEKAGSIYVIKEDMPYYLDSDGAVHRLIPELKPLTSTTSGKNSVAFKDCIYIPCGAQSLFEYDDGAVTELSPATFCTNLSDFNGRVQALYYDEQYLFAVLDNGANVELLAGRWETVDDTTDWRWHPIAELELDGCETCYTSSVYKKRLWIASTKASDSLYYYPLPTKYGDITGDTDYRFSNGGELITSWLHANFKADDKAHIKLILTLEDTSSTIYVEAHYRVLGQTGWTDIGDFKTSPITEAFLPQYDSDADEVADADPVGKMIQLKFVFKTPTTGGDAYKDTAKLLGYDLRAILKSNRRKIIYCAVQCKDNITNRKGETDSQSAAEIATALEACADATWPITHYDPWANTRYVNFLPLQVDVVEDEKRRPIERHYRLTLQQVTTADG